MFVLTSSDIVGRINFRIVKLHRELSLSPALHYHRGRLPHLSSVFCPLCEYGTAVDHGEHVRLDRFLRR